MMMMMMELVDDWTAAWSRRFSCSTVGEWRWQRGAVISFPCNGCPVVTAGCKGSGHC